MTETPVERAAFTKAAARLLPLLFACYIVAFLGRVNVGFAKLQMAESLNLSDAAYGFGAGILFIGYLFFEVPSNLILERVGARAWIARIMITWGIVSGAFAFVADIPWGPLPSWFGVPKVEFSYYALRFLLGVAEAGFFPGIILYLTYWFPSARRARTVAMFMTAIVVANVVGAPVSGAIMQYADGMAGWAGWRWLFVIEAAPSVFAGMAVFFLLPDGPKSASWLSPVERDAIVMRLASDDARASDGESRTAHGVRAAFTDGRVWALAFVYLTTTFALYGVNFWMPTIIQEMGVARTEYLRVGLLSMIPWGLAGVTMLRVSAHSDRSGERRLHVTVALVVTAAGLALLAIVENAAVPSMIALSLVTMGVLSAVSTFWSIPTALLKQSAAAAGIAWINSVGNLGGHFGPDLVGRMRDATGSSGGAFWFLAFLSLLGAAVLLVATGRRSPT